MANFRVLKKNSEASSYKKICWKFKQHDYKFLHGEAPVVELKEYHYKRFYQIGSKAMPRQAAEHMLYATSKLIGSTSPGKKERHSFEDLCQMTMPRHGSLSNVPVGLLGQ